MKPCTMGMGCDQYGVCYADALGHPERCPHYSLLAAVSLGEISLSDALNALAAAASGGDAKQAPGEAPQSGPKGNAR